MSRGRMNSEKHYKKRQHNFNRLLVEISIKKTAGEGLEISKKMVPNLIVILENN